MLQEYHVLRHVSMRTWILECLPDFLNVSVVKILSQETKNLALLLLTTKVTHKNIPVTGTEALRPLGLRMWDPQ